VVFTGRLLFTRCASRGCGHAAFVPDEDDWSVESYRQSVKRLIRSYLRDTIAGDLELSELPETIQHFLPEGCDVRDTTLQFLYREGTHKPTGLRISLRSGDEHVLTFY